MKFLLLKVVFFVSLFCCPYLASQTPDPVYAAKNKMFLNKRLSFRDKRASSFLLALELLQKRNAKVLVETGTSRCGKENFKGDGGSTVIFGHFASQMGLHLYSVDIDPGAVAKAQKAIKPYAKNVTVVCSDSIEFLENFDQPIDFLYLDSYDFEPSDPFPSQWHHLNELEAALPMLHKNSIIMIDDCDLPQGGKGKLVISYLLERGWRIAFQGYQVILVRN